MIENKAQSIAISHNLGPMLVLAGPGSGKTHVITKRIEYLIQEIKVRPEEILVITFTKYAAKEMKDRFNNNYKKQVPVTFGTFHGIFYGILKWAYNIGAQNILSEDEKLKLIREIISNSTEIDESFDIQMDDEKEFISNIGKEISIIKSEGISLDTYEAIECPNQVFATIFTNYESVRKKMRKIDFDDMILQCYKLLQSNKDVLGKWQKKFKYILIDEFQDINQMQFDTIRLLASPENNIFIVGDDDQSIYRFRGAKPDIMLNFQMLYPDTKKILLDTNYRSTKAIVNAATRVIGNNQNRYGKKVETPNVQGDTVHIQEVKDPLEESEYILKQILKLQKEGVPLHEIAVIFRTNLDGRVVASKMVEYGMPFQMREHLPNIYEHFIAKNMMAYMHMVIGNRNRNIMLEVMNRPNRYIARDAVLAGSMTGKINFEELRKFYCDKEWMQDRIDQLELDLRIMKNMTPYAVIQYVRKKIGYEEFLKEYAEFRKMNYLELIDVLDEIQNQTKEYKSIEEWFASVKEYEQKLKNRQNNNRTQESAVDFHTMHGAKGLEYDYVFVIECNEGVIPSKKAKLPDEIEEERRMFYVAMTRARKKLTIVYPKQKHGKDLHPSRFVHELISD
ncbi:MAG: ATP-dependent helicase [Eubacteriales bacterium]